MATQPLCLWREARLGSVTQTSPSGVSVCAEVWSAGPPAAAQVGRGAEQVPDRPGRGNGWRRITVPLPSTCCPEGLAILGGRALPPVGFSPWKLQKYWRLYGERQTSWRVSDLARDGQRSLPSFLSSFSFVFPTALFSLTAEPRASTWPHSGSLYSSATWAPCGLL